MSKWPSSILPAAIVALIVFDVVLVAVTQRHVRTDPSAQAGGHASAASNLPARSHGVLNGTSRVAPAAQVLLDLGDDGTLLRSSRGSCAEKVAPRVELSTDQGASFTDVTPVLAPPVAEVLRVEVVSRHDVWLVGANEGCGLAVLRSTDSGGSWSRSPGTQGAWHESLLTYPSSVHAPGDRTEAGCLVAAVAPVDSSTARVGCEDGQIRTTADSGATFEDAGTVKGIVSMAFRDPGVGFALASVRPCAAAVLATFDGGAHWTQRTCLQGSQPQAVAVNSRTVIAQVDGVISTSRDNARTWQSR